MYLPFPHSPQALPRLTVSLTQPLEDLPLHVRWSGRPVWPPDNEYPPPPDNEYPLTSPTTSTGVSNSEEEEHSEDDPLGQGQFTRGKAMRGKRSKGGQRARDTSSSDSTLMHSSSDSTLPKEGNSRCSSPGSSDSDAKTEDTATTMTLLPQMDRGESHIDGLMSFLTPGSGLTQKQLQMHSEKRKEKSASTARHLAGETSAARAVVRRPRREDTREKESPGTGE